LINKKTSKSYICGRNQVLAALRSETPIEKIFLLKGVHGDQIHTILNLAHQKKIICVETDKEKFRKIVGNEVSQGVTAIVGIKSYIEVKDILNIADEKKEKPFIIILDQIEDPHNLGAIIRTAECAGAHGIIIPKHRAASITTTISKTSTGAVEYLPIAKVTNLVSTIEELKLAGVWIVGTTINATKNYTEIDYKLPLAIVIGNEGSGIRRLVIEKCDFLVKIPIYGKTESLNASVSAGIIIYEVLKARKSF